MDYLIDDLLLIETKPGPMLGGKEVTTLATFISGYRACLRHFADNPHINSSSAFWGFNDFVEQKYGKKNAFGWLGLIRNDTENEEAAFDTFYSLLHEYLELDKVDK